MGKVVECHCLNCDWRKEFEINKRLHLMSSQEMLDEEQAVINDITSGEFGEPLRAYSDPHEVVNYDTLKEGVFYCESCHNYMLAKLISIQYSGRNFIVKTNVLPYCSKCRNEMKRIDKDEESNINLCCPECRGPVRKETLIKH